MIKIIKYSEKSIALFGDTKPVKDELKKIGAKFNRYLKDPDGDSKSPGWILSLKKLNDVIETLNKLDIDFENCIK